MNELPRPPVINMKGYNFTEECRRSLARAREEAVRLHHDFVGGEHILLGVIGDRHEAGSLVLAALGLDPETVRRDVEEVFKAGIDQKTGPDLPYTARTKKVLELSMKEAEELTDDYVGAEHLLLGLVGEGMGIAWQVLSEKGVTLEGARAAVRKLREGQVWQSPARSEDREVSAPPSGVFDYRIEVRYPDGRIVKQSFRNKMEALTFLFKT